jgi:hypothetical protein
MYYCYNIATLQYYNYCTPTTTVHSMAPMAFDDYENVNLAGSPQYADVEKALVVRLKQEVARWMVPWKPTTTTP